MDANVKGALAQINRSYRAFTHNDQRMTKSEVKAVLEYAINKGYEYTSEISDSEIDNVLTNHKK